MKLFERISKVESTNPYFQKDLLKSKNATKFIGRGSAASSTNKYMIAAGDLANCHNYVKEDIIFVSAEGRRSRRLSVDLEELAKATSVGAKFITDDRYNRSRPYNVGEMEVEKFLISQGYHDNNGTGIWEKS